MDPSEEHPEKPKKKFREIVRKYLVDSDSVNEKECHGISLSPRRDYHFQWSEEVIFSPELVNSEPPTPRSELSDEEFIDEYEENFDQIPILDRCAYDSDDANSDEDDSDAMSEVSDESSCSEASSASKYRYTKRTRSQNRSESPGRRWRVTNPTPGTLVWALLPAQYGTPWWPAVVIDKTAVLIKTKRGDEVVAYRILLVCPPNHLAFNGSFYVKDRNLRALKTQQDFDDFMKASVSVSHKQLYRISQFQIPVLQEAYWNSARRIYFLVEQLTASSLAERMLQLGLSLPEYQKIWEEEDAKRTEVLIPLENVSQRNEIVRIKTFSGHQVSIDF